MPKSEVVAKQFDEPIRASIVALENEIEVLEKKLQGVDEIYAELRTKKKQISVLERTVRQLDGSPVARGVNRPRGQNLKDITEFLSANESATVREIAEATGINVPSVRYTLGRNEQFESDKSNRWTIEG